MKPIPPSECTIGVVYLVEGSPFQLGTWWELWTDNGIYWITKEDEEYGNNTAAGMFESTTLAMRMKTLARMVEAYELTVTPTDMSVSQFRAMYTMYNRNYDPFS